MKKHLYVGMPVLSIHGEVGETHFGLEIETGPFALGLISAINTQYDSDPITVVFTGGIIAALNIHEIYNQADYVLDIPMPPGFASEHVLGWAESEPDDADQYRILARKLLAKTFEQPSRLQADAKVSYREFEVSLKGHVFIEKVVSYSHDTGNSVLDAREHAVAEGITMYPTHKWSTGLDEQGNQGIWLEIGIIMEKDCLTATGPDTEFTIKSVTGYPHKRTEMTYTSHEEEEASFQQLLTVWNQVSDILVTKPAGTLADYEGGTLVMGELHGSIVMFDSPDICAKAVKPDANLFRIEDFDGIGKSDFDQIQVNLKEWLEAPRFLEMEPVLIAKCIEYNYRPDATSSPFWAWDGKLVK